MPYILIVASIISFSVGFGVSHQIDKAELQQMRNDIASQNTLAETTLREKTREVEAASATAIKLNLDLDASHESTINALNAQRDSFVNRGLRDPGSRASCSGSLPASKAAGISERAADTSQLSAELTGFLRREAYRADRAAELYAECRQFALTDNCGIAKE